MSEYALVTTHWLHDHLTQPDIRIIDIRGHVLPADDPPPHYFSHKEDYLKSHIPGALFVDWVHDITDAESPHGAQIATPDAYADLMGELGIGDNTLVIAYDDAEGMFAARLWWTLRYYGHDNVAVLDGGWQKWIAEGRVTTDKIPTVEPVTFTPKPVDKLRHTLQQVEASLNSPQMALIDVRTPAEFNGEASRASRSGHIPGALNLPRKSLITEDGTMLSPEKLRERFAKIGVEADQGEVVLYCNGGVSASYGMLALYAAGFRDVSVYDGSWKEWGNLPDKPIG